MNNWEAVAGVADSEVADGQGAVQCSAGDAEAAARALGPQLEWQRDCRYRDFEQWYGYAEPPRYLIREIKPCKDGERVVSVFEASRQFDSLTMVCDSLQAARAACEHHYTTGAWE